MKLIKYLTFVLVAMFAAVVFSKDLVVGGKNFTEQYLVAEMTRQLLEKHGFNVEVKVGLGSKISRLAQINGELDIMWEYTGTSLINFNQIKDKMTPQQTYETVKRLDGEKGLVWLAPNEVDNTYALAMRRTVAQTQGMSTLEDMAAAYNRGENLKFGMDTEFIARPDGLPGLQKAYGFSIPRKNRVSMEPGLLYNALRSGQLDIGIVFATDGRVAAYDFIILEDTKEFFPSYALIPVVRHDTLTKYPELENLLNGISQQLNDSVLQKLNAAVDIDKKSVEEVARNFLKENRL